MKNKVVVKVINNSKNALPKYETLMSAGMDVRADLDRFVFDEDDELKFGFNSVLYKENNPKCLVINPGGRCLIPTGLFIALPQGYEVQVRPRSGLALKQGLTVLNTPGTIDADYRGEIGVVLINHGENQVIIHDSDRIAQLVLTKCESIEWEVTDNLDETERGEGGFSSTGVK